MAVMIFVIWGLALLVLFGLGGVLILTLRAGDNPSRTGVDGAAPLTPTTDTLLLYHEESVRRTPGGDVVLRIPGAAWAREWQDDLVRLEVTRADPSTVEVPAAWGEANVLAAYDLRAHRMTEIGTDIAVERFAAPVDLFLVADGPAAGLRVGMREEASWVLAPPAVLPQDVLEQAGIPASQSWAATSISELGQVCLVRVLTEADL
jgi:hypothetical protein